MKKRLSWIVVEQTFFEGWEVRASSRELSDLLSSMTTEERALLNATISSSLVTAHEDQEDAWKLLELHGRKLIVECDTKGSAALVMTFDEATAIARAELADEQGKGHGR